MTHASSIYSGWVMHRRLRPVRHEFRYRAWWLLLDLDEVDTLGERLRFFSRNRRNVLSFYDADHGHDGSDLRAQVERRLAETRIDCDGGPIRLLCTPRVLGYQFNPLSIYFCYRRDGSLAATVYEVHNTFGERHSYCLAADARQDGRVRQKSDKQFYVSPFMGMGMDYDFRVAPPSETLTVGITGSEHKSPLIHAVLQADRQDVSDRRLLALLCTHPLVTWKVIAAIHVEAFRLWRKGLPIHPRHRTKPDSLHDNKAPERQHV